MRNPAKRAASLCIVALASASLTACGGASAGNVTTVAETCDKVTLQYAAYSTPKSPAEITMAGWYASELERRTNGCVTMKGSWSGALLGGDTMLEGVSSHQVDMGEINPIYYPTQLPLTQVVGLPFTNDGNPAAVTDAYAKLYESDEEFRAEWENNGVVVLAWKQLGPAMMGTKKPITSLDDMKGLKVRTVGNVTKVYDAIGADPIGIPGQEVYESLQRGTIDAYAGQSFEYIPQQSFAEVAPYTYETGTGVYAIDTAVINKSLYDSLGEDVQQVLVDLRNEFSAKLTEVEGPMGVEACDALLKQGATVGVFSDDIAAQWKTAVGDTVYKSWAETIGDEEKAKTFFDRYTKQVETEQKNYPGFQSAARVCVNS
jgi:TRAP-type C4-dicarboxylate transport system substrate-binding protein